MPIQSLSTPAWSGTSHRAWATTASFSLQALLVTCLLAFSIFHGESLPMLRSAGPIVLPSTVAPAPEASQANRDLSRSGTSIPAGAQVLPLERVPSIPDFSGTGPTTPPATGDLELFSSSMASANPGIGSFFPAATVTLAVPKPAPRPVQMPTSHVMEAYLIKQVKPQYPYLAKVSGIQGTVILHALISKEGVIEQLQVVSGHPMLVPAAVQAVQQWRYRPYYLNGEAVEVETQVTVNFVLGGG